MYRALVGIGMLCGLLIVFVYAGTRTGASRRNRAADRLERSPCLRRCYPAATTATRTFVLTPAGGFEPAADAKGERIHAGFDQAGRLVGVAIEARGMGYADTIGLLYGYAPARDAIVGMQVLTSKETPGLGNKIETDPDFLANFEALDVRLDDSGTSLRNPIETVKKGKKTEPWQSGRHHRRDGLVESHRQYPRHQQLTMGAGLIRQRRADLECRSNQ